MTFKAFSIAFIAVTLGACSSQPTQPSANTAAPAAATPSAALSPPKSAAEAVPVASSADGKPPALSRPLIEAGYKATTIKGEIFYCRQEVVTGTGFKKKVCLTEDQIKDEERRIQAMQDQLMRTHANPSCLGPTC